MNMRGTSRVKSDEDPAFSGGVCSGDPLMGWLCSDATARRDPRSEGVLPCCTLEALPLKGRFLVSPLEKPARLVGSGSGVVAGEGRQRPLPLLQV